MNKPIEGAGEMEITERKLLNGYEGFCEGGSCSHFSIVNGRGISWDYRRNDEDGHCRCCLPGEAEFITVGEAKIPLDESHNSHPAIAKINDAEEWVRV